jgi:release factor glutamine methyltransferase
MPRLIEVLQKATAYLTSKGVETPRLDAEVLLAHGLGMKRLDLYLQHDRPLDERELERLRAPVVERGRGVPVAYLTGEREFYSLPFRVTRDVLIPRPETEAVVEAALKRLRGREAPRFADLGTGSGCIAVAVLHRLPAARGIAVDVSAAAVEVARGNAHRHGVDDRLTLHVGSWLDPLRGGEAWGRLDAVLSNPPYVEPGDPTLAPDVAANEPAGALYAPKGDALAPAREIATAAREALAPGGLLAIEIGPASAPRAEALLRDLGYEDVSVLADLGGRPRVVVGTKAAASPR